jgi:hypothetical protein
MLGLQAVNRDVIDMNHVHPIVVKVGDKRAQFDVEALMESFTLQVDLATLF